MASHQILQRHFLHLPPAAPVEIGTETPTSTGFRTASITTPGGDS
jgi:hypothetical protein